MLEDALVNSVNPINTGIRSIFISIDIGVYGLLKLIYELFFSIATTEILDREMIFNVVSRVQLIIGIFMMFQLVMIIIKGIVNPDSATDSKTGGAGAIVMRIIVSLSLMALLVPINIKNPKNEYEKQIYNNGVLFGTLYSLQYRILTNNTLGKIILDNKETYYTAGSEDVGSLYKISDRLTSTIVKAFYSLNTKKNDDTGEYEYVCDDDFIEEYNNGDISPFLVIGYGLKKCGNIFTGGRSYALKMSYLISTIVGIVMVIIMFMICFEVAKRVFQLAALQLIAPIPIISYMDPKGSKDGAFNSWVKLLTTTYLDLFTRLAVIYFSFAVITAFMDKFFGSGSLDTLVGTAVELGKGDILTAPIILPLMFIIMVIALLIFAKDAPKFFKQMLGIKDNGNGFFSTFGNAVGLGATAAGALGSFKASRDASRDSMAAKLKNGNPNLSREQAQAMAGTGLGNKAKHALAGMFGAGMGLAKGSAAASESKGNAFSKLMASANAMNDRNKRVREAGRNGGGFFGAVGSLGEEIINGQSEYDALEADWKRREQKIKDDKLVLKTKQDANNRRKNIMDRSKSKATDCEYTEGTYKDICGNYRDFHSAYEAAINNGIGVHTQYISVNGGTPITKVEYDELSATEQAAYHEDSWFEYSYTDRNGVVHDHQKIKMAQAKDIDQGLYDKNVEDFYESDVRYEYAYNDAIAAGATEAEAIAAASAVGHKDNSIDADRRGYREAKIAEYMAKGETRDEAMAHDDINLELVYGSATGLKAKFGDYANENNAESDRINREEEKVNSERQGYEGQKAQYNAKRFRK